MTFQIDTGVAIPQLPAVYADLDMVARRAVRHEYMRLQGGLCYHCKQPLGGKPSKKIMGMHIKSSLFPPRFFEWPVHLHHSHETGLTLGAVHARCNAVLWQYHGE